MNSGSDIRDFIEVDWKNDTRADEALNFDGEPGYVPDMDCQDESTTSTFMFSFGTNMASIIFLSVLIFALILILRKKEEKNTEPKRTKKTNCQFHT